ncbi:MAG: Set1 complex component Ash2 [Amphiamblys sp. WSBS2006]|nr:MAG: Set1 complex component Ash2 [Amphiamblys sp. WSBS2006]
MDTIATAQIEGAQHRATYKNTDFDIDQPDTPAAVAATQIHTAHQLKVVGNTVTGHGGYSTAKATHGVSSGKWCYEATVDGCIGHCRLGWGQILAEKQAPIGYDEYGYCYSDTGKFFHCSLSLSNSETFGLGDVIGCVICIEDGETRPETQTDPSRTYPPLRKGVYNVEQKISPGSFIEFYKNGVCVGRPFTDIYHGRYYPSVSLFGGASITLNFGPVFFCDTPPGCSPLCSV